MLLGSLPHGWFLREIGLKPVLRAASAIEEVDGLDPESLESLLVALLDVLGATVHDLLPAGSILIPNLVAITESAE